MSLDENTPQTDAAGANKRSGLAARLGSFDDTAQTATVPEAAVENDEQVADAESDPIDAIGSTDVFDAAAPEAPEADVTETTVAPSIDVLSGPASSFDDVEPRKKHHLWIIPVVLAALLAAAYAGGAYYFSDKFLPGTTVDGKDVSLTTVEELTASINAETSDYALTIDGDGVSCAIKASDVDLGYDGQALAEEAFAKTNAWEWPLEVTRTRSITLDRTLTYDADKLSQILTPIVDSSTQAAQEAAAGAKIVYDSSQSHYVLEGSGDTRHLDGDALTAAVDAALLALEPSLTIGDEVLSGAEDFSTVLAQANAYLDAAPTLTLAGGEVGTLSADQIASWITFDADLNPTLDENAVVTWAKGDLSKQLDTVGTTRTYTRPDGKSVTVSGGTYGWNIDGATLAASIVEAIKSGEKQTLEVPTKQQAAVYSSGGADWGNRYIDIDLSEQHVRMYDASGSLIWESDCVTGLTSDDRETPCGVYSMTSYRAQGDVELKGKIDPTTNEPEYISYVDYWMPFIGNSYALHDADWRSTFGGNIYTYNGSHGCVNLPVDKAAELFGLTEVGDVVVVHY